MPIWMRKPCINLYSYIFSCNLDEIEINDLSQFKTMSEFFRRSLKPYLRLIDQKSCLVRTFFELGKHNPFGYLSKEFTI